MFGFGFRESRLLGGILLELGELRCVWIHRIVCGGQGGWFEQNPAGEGIG